MSNFDFNSQEIRDLSLQIFDNLDYVDEKNNPTLYSASLIPIMCFFMLKEYTEEEAKKTYRDIVNAVIEGKDLIIPAYNDVKMIIKSEKDRTLRTMSLYTSIFGECLDFFTSLVVALHPETATDKNGEEILDDNLFTAIFKKGTFSFNAMKYTLQAYDFINNLAQQDIVLFENKDNVRLSHFNLSLKDPQEQVRWACLIIGFFIMKKGYSETQSKKKNSHFSATTTY